MLTFKYSSMTKIREGNENFFKLEFGSYGSESVVGTISEPQYNYWIKNEDRLSEYLNVFDKDNKEVPANAQIQKDWFEIDDLAHANGPHLDDENNTNFTIIETDQNDVEISRQEHPFHTENLKHIKVECVGKSFNHEDTILKNKFYFIGHSFEKGVYYTDELIKTDSKELALDKLEFHYTEIDGYKILHKINYDKGTHSITGDTRTNASEMKVFKGDDIKSK